MNVVRVEETRKMSSSLVGKPNGSSQDDFGMLQDNVK
jgi:hypothetical protein